MTVKSMDVNELKELIDKNANIVLVDCREQDEWDAGHIEQAQFIPLSDFANQYKKLNPDDQIIMQCRSGQRSMQAAMYLVEQGYKDLTNLEGGILDWSAAGFPVTK